MKPATGNAVARSSSASRPATACPMRPQRRFRFALPLLWAATSWTAMDYSGDEHGLWYVGSLPGVWVASLAPSGWSVRSLMILAIIAGAPLLALLGWAMDRVRVGCWAWVGLWLALGTVVTGTAIRSHPSYARAIAKDGSLQAYILFGANVSLMMTSLLTVSGYGVVQLIRWHRRGGWSGDEAAGPRCERCGYNLTGCVSGRCPECGESLASHSADGR